MSTGSSDNLTPLGKAGVRRILPWLRSKSNHDSKADYVVVICDPRDKSLDLRRVIREVAAGGGGDGGTLPVDARERIVFISADSPAENKKFTKKFKLGTPENIFSDEKKDWMREYTALGDKVGN